MLKKCVVFALIFIVCLQGLPLADAGAHNHGESSTGTSQESVNTSSSTGNSDPNSALWDSTVMPCLSSDVTACYPQSAFAPYTPGCDCFLNFCGCLGSDNEYNSTRDGCYPAPFLTCPKASYASESAVRVVNKEVTCKSLNRALCFSDETMRVFNESQPGCICYLNYCGCLSDGSLNSYIPGCKTPMLSCLEGTLNDPYLTSAGDSLFPQLPESPRWDHGDAWRNSDLYEYVHSKRKNRDSTIPPNGRFRWDGNLDTNNGKGLWGLQEAWNYRNQASSQGTSDPQVEPPTSSLSSAASGLSASVILIACVILSIVGSLWPVT